jgi:hypothetical protein
LYAERESKAGKQLRRDREEEHDEQGVGARGSRRSVPRARVSPSGRGPPPAACAGGGLNVGSGRRPVKSERVPCAPRTVPVTSSWCRRGADLACRLPPHGHRDRPPAPTGRTGHVAAAGEPDGAARGPPLLGGRARYATRQPGIRIGRPLPRLVRDGHRQGARADLLARVSSCRTRTILASSCSTRIT